MTNEYNVCFKITTQYQTCLYNNQSLCLSVFCETPTTENAQTGSDFQQLVSTPLECKRGQIRYLGKSHVVEGFSNWGLWTQRRPQNK